MTDNVLQEKEMSVLNWLREQGSLPDSLFELSDMDKEDGFTDISEKLFVDLSADWEENYAVIREGGKEIHVFYNEQGIQDFVDNDLSSMDKDQLEELVTQLVSPREMLEKEWNWKLREHDNGYITSEATVATKKQAAGSGIGAYRRGEVLKDAAEVKALRPGQLLIYTSEQYKATNLIKVTQVLDDKIFAIFVDPENPAEKYQASNEEFKVRLDEFKDGGYFICLEPAPMAATPEAEDVGDEVSPTEEVSTEVAVDEAPVEESTEDATEEEDSALPLAASKKTAGTELWETPEGKYWLLSTVTMSPVSDTFGTKEEAVDYGIESGRWVDTIRDRLMSSSSDGKGIPEDMAQLNASKKTADKIAEYVGVDDWGLDLYKYQDTVYADVDGVLHAITYEGEPDYPVKDIKMAPKEASKKTALTVPEKHQKKIALDTLKMSDAGAGIMGGMSKDEAREFLKGIGYSEDKIKKIEGSKKTVAGEGLSAGFAIGTSPEDMIVSNAEDRDITLDDAAWEKINEDSLQIERNIIKILEEKYNITCRDEGHDGDGDLIGTCWPTSDENADSVKEMWEEYNLEGGEPYRFEGALEIYEGTSDISHLIDASVEFFNIEQEGATASKKTAGKPHGLSKGDKVMLADDVLQQHSRSVPPHAGYTTEQFSWRDTLDQRAGQEGVIERTFGDSGHVNMEFPDGSVIGIDGSQLVKVSDMEKTAMGEEPAVAMEVSPTSPQVGQDYQSPFARYTDDTPTKTGDVDEDDDEPEAPEVFDYELVGHDTAEANEILEEFGDDLDESVVINDDEMIAYYSGKPIAESKDWDELATLIKAWMDEGNYWTGVFVQGERGNVEPMMLRKKGSLDNFEAKSSLDKEDYSIVSGGTFASNFLANIESLDKDASAPGGEGDDGSAYSLLTDGKNYTGIDETEVTAVVDEYVAGKSLVGATLADFMGFLGDAYGVPKEAAKEFKAAWDGNERYELVMAVKKHATRNDFLD